MAFKLWIDDVRPAPKGYVWCQSTNEALCLIVDNINSVEELHLDHDMGDTFGGDAIIILNELERKSHWDDDFADAVNNIVFKIHSANPVGVDNMRRIIQRNGWKEV